MIFLLGVYNIEPLSDMSWSVLGFGLNVGYHFWILQSVALVCMSDFLLEHYDLNVQWIIWNIQILEFFVIIGILSWIYHIIKYIEYMV